MDEGDLIDVVGDAMRQVAADVIVPHFRSLVEGDVTEKGPDDLVTVADTEAERALTRILAALLPSSVVVGEEAVAARPDLVRLGASSDRTWVIDPIDGTGNFVAGTGDFTVMVALIERSRTTAAWILHPMSDRMFTAVLGAGARVDGSALVRAPAPSPLAELRGSLVTRLIDPATAVAVGRRAESFGHLEQHRLPGGVQYCRVALGELDVVLYWRTLVWDHAPGALILEEAGGRVARLDGAVYEPWSDRKGLLLAADAATHGRAAAQLAPTGHL